LRYEKIDQVIPWVKGFYVEEPEQLRPTLEKAFLAAEKGGFNGKGGPALVHVPVEPSIVTPSANWAYGLHMAMGHLPFAKMSKYGKLFRQYFMGQHGPASYPWFDFEKWGFPKVEDSEMPDQWEAISDEWAEP
jgi:hypothetical protein